MFVNEMLRYQVAPLTLDCRKLGNGNVLNNLWLILLANAKRNARIQEVLTKNKMFKRLEHKNGYG